MGKSRFMNVIVNVRLGGELLEEVDCFKYLRLYEAANEGFEREEICRRSWGSEMCDVSLIKNTGLGLSLKKVFVKE